MRKPLLAKQTYMARTLTLFSLSILAALFIACIPASAQSDWRLFGGFSYVRSDTSPLLEPFEPQYMNSIGWGLSVTQYMSQARWFGATAEFSGNYKNPRITIPANFYGEGDPATNTDITNAIHTSFYTAMFGPSFAYRHNPGFEPFAHFLLGGVRQKASLTGKGQNTVGISACDADWEFGYAIGGGADFKMSKLVAFRVQGDWIRSTFPDADKDRQNNIKVMAGFVFHFEQ